MNPRMLTVILGGVVILLAFVTPFSGLHHVLGVRPDNRTDELLLGITLFKYSLVTFGFFLIVLGRLPIWQPVTRAEKAPSDPRRHSLNLAIITAILSVATVLRLYALDSGLWHDEIFTYLKFASMPVGEILTTYDSQNQNFLYSLLVRACFYTFGEGPWSLRLPAVIFGVASIWAAYFFGRQIVSETEALLTAALLTVSYHHIWFSQNARGYTGLLFWALLASGFFLR